MCTHILQLVDLRPSFEQLFSPFTGNLFDLLVVVSNLDVQLFVQLLDLGISSVDIKPCSRELIPQLVDPLDKTLSSHTISESRPDLPLQAPRGLHHPAREPRAQPAARHSPVSVSA